MDYRQFGTAQNCFWQFLLGLETKPILACGYFHFRGSRPDARRRISAFCVLTLISRMTTCYFATFRLTVVTLSTSRLARILFSSPPRLERFPVGNSLVVRYSAEKIAF
jgi:hypothetical protein